MTSLESRNHSKYSAYTQAVSRNNQHSNEKIAYFKTEDGNNLVSVQTNKTSRHTPDKREPHKNSKSQGQMKRAAK